MTNVSIMKYKNVLSLVDFPLPLPPQTPIPASSIKCWIN